MSTYRNVHQFSLFLILANLIKHFRFQVAHSNRRSVNNLQVVSLSWIYGDFSTWNDAQRGFLQLLHLIVRIEVNLNFFLWVINQSDWSMSLPSYLCHTEVDVLVFNFLKLKFERNSFTFYLHDHSVKSIYVKYQILLVLVVLSWSEDNWNS